GLGGSAASKEKLRGAAVGEKGDALSKIEELRSFVELAARTGVLSMSSLSAWDERGGSRYFSGDEMFTPNGENKGLLTTDSLYRIKNNDGEFEGIYQKNVETPLNVGGLAKTLMFFNPGMTKNDAQTAAKEFINQMPGASSPGAIGNIMSQLVMSKVLDDSTGAHTISVVGDKYQSFFGIGDLGKEAKFAKYGEALFGTVGEVKKAAAAAVAEQKTQTASTGTTAPKGGKEKAALEGINSIAVVINTDQPGKDPANRIRSPSDAAGNLFGRNSQEQVKEIDPAVSDLLKKIVNLSDDNQPVVDLDSPQLTAQEKDLLNTLTRKGDSRKWGAILSAILAPENQFVRNR
ncbi:MAG: hypothetical protein AAB356_07675, partial [Deltaproteobacteria bacterium]